MGHFKLNPAPPGRFFVKIDGRTAVDSHWPDGDYFPYVGKAWEAIAGRADNLAGGSGEIYLPLIPAGTLQPVSLTEERVITFPASMVASEPNLALMKLTVPANSLFSDDGRRGGKVGIALVPSDRLPSPLPPCLEDNFDITLQSDGAINFADGESGLALVNFLPSDIGAVAPRITLSASFSLNPAAAEEQKEVTVRANADDDVRVRHVEFYLDGVKSWTSGSYPFEFRFVTPARSPFRTAFRLHAKATDTGGNSAWSDEMTIMLLPNLRPPRVLAVNPPPGRRLAPSSVTTLTVQFNHAMDGATLDPDTVHLFEAGPDGEPGTPDDRRIPNLTVRYAAANKSVEVVNVEPLAAGRYRLQ